MEKLRKTQGREALSMRTSTPTATDTAGAARIPPPPPRARRERRCPLAAPVGCWSGQQCSSLQQGKRLAIILGTMQHLTLRLCIHGVTQAASTDAAEVIFPGQTSVTFTVVRPCDRVTFIDRVATVTPHASSPLSRR